MFKLLIIALFITISSAYNARIVNGTNAEPNEFPFIVSLRNNQVDHDCGGTILNENYILTAAHCVCDFGTPRDPSNYTIQYGSIYITADYTRSIQVQQIHCNQFDFYDFIFDTAILKLETPLPDTADWEPVKLVKEFNTSEVHEGAVTIGWGRLYTNGPMSETLQKLDVTIYPDAWCKNSHMFDPEHHICFGVPEGNQGVCNGDSGGPLLFNGYQVGITSFMPYCGLSTPSRPDVDARITRYLDWIHSITDIE